MAELYENPLITRYAGAAMAQNFSDIKRFKTWRRLWIALAECQKELGLPITDNQIRQMKDYAEDINISAAKEHEKRLRHDVMAHIHAYGQQAPDAMPIIHLGATSCFVTDNADLIIIDNALDIIRIKLLSVIKNLRNFAQKYKDTPVLGFTHLQPAQLTTVGKRASLWLWDIYCDYNELVRFKESIRLRGVKGTTGTQASFLSLFEGNEKKVSALEKAVIKKLGYKSALPVTGQTYSRKFDYNLLALLSQIAQSASKFANDLRILQSLKELEEPFEDQQIGSSAMAYKRNPMRSERLCSLARYVISLPQNAAMTASAQWLERTLDDSANRRIIIPQAFLAIDGILNLYQNITGNISVYGEVIAAHIRAELPFMATEEILMECVKKGGDRQQLHEKIRVHSMQSAKAVKEEGKPNDLIERIKADPAFSCVHDSIEGIIDPNRFIGRAPQQTMELIKDYIDPLLDINPVTDNPDKILL